MIHKLWEIFLRLFKRYESVILYVFFGGLTTVVSFATHFGVRFLGGEVWLATTASWICAVLFAFFTNRSFVFKSRTVGTAAFLLQIAAFFGARGFSLLVELGIMTAFVKYMQYNEFFVKLAANVVVLILNYVLSKLIVFRKSKNEKSREE